LKILRDDEVVSNKQLVGSLLQAVGDAGDAYLDPQVESIARGS
jgi:hypothetical protein